MTTPTVFDRPLNGFRLVETQFGDTMQAIAARELQDASKWTDIVYLNGLKPPYLTDDAALASDSVRLYGQILLVPSASNPTVTAEADPDLVFGIDCALNDGRLFANDSGDIATVAGRANLRQALGNLAKTERRELIYHLDYGISLRKFIGEVNGPTAAILGAEIVKSGLAADPRVDNVQSTNVTISGDVMSVAAVVEPIVGAPLDVNTKVA